MQILVQYTLTPAEALRGTRAFKWTWYLTSVAAGALLIIMARISLRTATLSQGMALFMMFNGLLLLLLPEAVLRWAGRRRGPAAYPPTEVALDDEGLTLRTDASEGSLPWSAFASVRHHTGFWFFRVNRSQAVIVPERAMEASASEELEAFLRERKLLKG